MNLYIVVLAFLFVLSLAAIAYILLSRRALPSKKRPLTTDARQMLHDLTNGGAIVRVTVIDPDGLLVYRGGEK